MAKDPAVLFYYQDFLVGTAFLTNEQVGAYQRILCHLFDKGTLPEKEMKKICVTSECWNAIKNKFVIDENGELYNVRSRYEKLKRVKFTESRANNRKNKKKTNFNETDMNNISTTSVEDMENENLNENLNEIKNLKEVPDDLQNKIRAIFISAWRWNIPTEHLMNLALELVREHGMIKVKKAALICSEYERSKWSLKYLSGVLKGMSKAEEIAKIKDREARAAALKAEEKNIAWDPETSKIFNDIINKYNIKDQKDNVASNQKLRNKQFQEDVEKGIIK